MKQIVGIMQDPRGHPVKQDADGTPAEVKTGPYLLDDGVSLEAPIPVVIVTDSSYVDSAGNLRGVWPMNITGLAEPPVNAAAPVITGNAMFGQVLTSTIGTWSGTEPITYTRQWYRGTTAISGATGATYTTVAADLGAVISVRVTATNSEGSAVASSAGTANIGRVPFNTAAPTITGTPIVGQTLTASNGTWSAYPAATYSRQWQRNGINISGATATTYALTAADVGAAIRCVITASNTHGFNTANTAAVTVAFDWSQFQFTSGTDGVQWIGYSDGGADRPQPAFGTLAAQPTTVTNLLAIYDDTASGNYIVVFTGDYLSLMSSLPMTIGSTTYTPFDASIVNGNTWIRYTGDGDWVDAIDYTVTFG